MEAAAPALTGRDPTRNIDVLACDSLGLGQDGRVSQGRQVYERGGWGWAGEAQMRQWQQWRKAAVWGCVAWFSTCPYYDLGSNALPLEFGMTPAAAAAALNAPLTRLTGRNGSEVYYAERAASTPGLLYTYEYQVWLQFRRGRLTGWNNDWRR